MYIDLTIDDHFEMETYDIHAQRNIHKSILVGGILCLAVVSSTKSNNGMH